MSDIVEGAFYFTAAVEIDSSLVKQLEPCQWTKSLALILALVLSKESDMRLIINIDIKYFSSLYNILFFFLYNFFMLSSVYFFFL